MFPELINLKRPLIPEEKPIEDSTAYTVIGAVEKQKRADGLWPSAR